MLAEQLRRLDGRSYSAYKQLAGGYEGRGFQLWIDRVQGDPFAAPSRVRLLLTPTSAGLPPWALSSRDRRSSCADFLNRVGVRRCREAEQRAGSGRGGELSLLRPSQAVLERTSALVYPDGGFELRFCLGLPAQGRRVLGRAATQLLCERVPQLAAGLRAEAIDLAALQRHVETIEDAQALRGQLAERGLIAFVAEGALLARRSGVDERPLSPAEGGVPFAVPPELAVTLETPNGGPRRGLGVPAGVTLITGGGYHGKSTLLRAIEQGVYDHVPGDGREAVVTLSSAVKVRAEDGRSVRGVDISGFIGELPGGLGTQAFTSANASGSTSQAAALVEALELGARCLLIDEDTSATNFMIRDARMQALIPAEREPITPLIDRVGALRAQGVSLVLVVGGCGDYFDVADTVLALEDYRPRCVTEAARAVAARLPTQRRVDLAPWSSLGLRVPLPASLDLDPAGRDGRGPKLRVPARDRCLLGSEEVALGAVEQLIEESQVRAIAQAWIWARSNVLDGRRSLPEVVEEIMARVSVEGLELLQSQPAGDLSEFRAHELAAFLNRLRSLALRVRAD